MARKRNPVPSYLKHPSGKARAVWTDSAGVRQYRLLPGAYDSKESKEAFAAVQLEAASTPVAATETGYTSVNELFVAFLLHAEKHYRRPDGSHTSELQEYKSLIKLVRPMYGDKSTGNFGPLALKAVRELLVSRRLCRSLVNQRIGRLKRIFRWGVGEELVPATVHVALSAVAGLQRGRCDAPESDPVGPVHCSIVDATLPCLNRHVRGLVQFQRLTGCRPGEACLLRRRDIDMVDSVWIYTPRQHKTAWRGKVRSIAIGPQAQALLQAFFTPDIEDFLFSPARMMREFRAAQRDVRKTPVQPSQRVRAKARPRKRPGECYSTRSYAEAVSRACEKAGVEHWHPNQLRHSHATRVRKQFGIEHAGASLGHTKMSATQVYAQRDAGLALEVAAKIG